MRYQTVVVGTDGSETALKAVTTAAELATAMQIPLTVVVAYHPVPAREQAWITPGLGDARFRVTGTEQAQEVLDAAVMAARDAGPPRSMVNWSRVTRLARCCLLRKTAHRPCSQSVIGE
jgi:nucleotide-binding universal stress UspA family protein